MFLERGVVFSVCYPARILCCTVWTLLWYILSNSLFEYHTEYFTNPFLLHDFSLSMARRSNDQPSTVYSKRLHITPAGYQSIISTLTPLRKSFFSIPGITGCLPVAIIHVTPRAEFVVPWGCTHVYQLIFVQGWEFVRPRRRMDISTRGEVCKEVR